MSEREKKMNRFSVLIKAEDIRRAAEKVGVTTQTVRNAMRAYVSTPEKLTERQIDCISVLQSSAKERAKRIGMLDAKLNV